VCPDPNEFIMDRNRSVLSFGMQWLEVWEMLTLSPENCCQGANPWYVWRFVMDSMTTRSIGTLR
jgi:hypothetical protein